MFLWLVEAVIFTFYKSTLLPKNQSTVSFAEICLIFLRIGVSDLKIQCPTVSDLSEGLASSTPLKPKLSASPTLSALQAQENMGSDPSDVHTKSSSSISIVPSSSSSSFERSTSSMTVSLNRRENDSLAQNLLDDFSGRILSHIDGNSLEGNFSCGGLLTDEEDYLNDDFEEERDSDGGEVWIGGAGTNGDVDSVNTDGDGDDEKDVNCGYHCSDGGRTSEENKVQ